MKRKTIILLAFFVAVVVAIVLVYREYNRENLDLAEAAADTEIEAMQLITAYEKSDTTADAEYRNKILLVSGKIKTLDTAADRYTIVLGEEASMSSVRCLIDSKYLNQASGLSVGQSVKIRGAITGFKKDDLGIGSDVELNRCVVVK